MHEPCTRFAAQVTSGAVDGWSVRHTLSVLFKVDPSEGPPTTDRLGKWAALLALVGSSLVLGTDPAQNLMSCAGDQLFAAVERAKDGVPVTVDRTRIVCVSRVEPVGPGVRAVHEADAEDGVIDGGAGREVVVPVHRALDPVSHSRRPTG